MRTSVNLEHIQARHARLLAALLACDNPHSQRANELRNMMRELERDVKALEQQRVLEMAARLNAPADSEAS